MVTYEAVFEHLGRRPFQPFRVMLSTGEAIDIVRPNQAVTTNRQMICGDGERVRWVQLSGVDRIEPLGDRPAGTGEPKPA